MNTTAKDPAPLHRLELAIPFALIGLFGGYLAAVCFHVDPLAHQIGSTHYDNPDRPIGWMLTVVTPFASGALGAFLAPHARGSATRVGFVSTGATLVAGIVNGILVGLFVGGVFGMIAGAVMGAVSSLPFVPAIVAVMLAARHVGRARAGSIVDAAHRRGIWRTAGVSIAVSAVAAASIWIEHSYSVAVTPHPVVAVAVFAGLLLVAAVLSLDFIAWIRARRATVELRELAPATLPPIAGERGVVDFGVGEGAKGIPRVPSYRGPDGVPALFIGDLHAARRLLGRMAAIGAFAVLIVVAAALASS